MQATYTKDSPGGERLDVFLSKKAPEHSRSFFLHHIRSEGVEINGKRVTKASTIVFPEDIISLAFTPLSQDLIANPDVPLDCIYEDKDTIVINKRRGQIVHPGSGDISKKESIVNALLAREDFYHAASDNARPGIVHRLDKDTTGTLLIAKHDQALSFYSKQFEDRTVIKKYIALVHGIPETEHGIIEAPLARSLADRKKMAIMPQGKYAKTEFSLLGSHKGLSLLDITLHTGRTHQIRVHLASIKLPIVHDHTYGTSTNTEDSQALHSSSLTFQLYDSHTPITVVAGLPPAFLDLLEKAELIDVLPEEIRYNGHTLKTSN